MTRCVLFTIFLLFSTAALQAAEMFSSNELGMELEPILPSQAGSQEWVLSVSTEGATVVRSLEKNGEPFARWEDSYQQGRLVKQRKYEKDALVEMTEYRNGHPVRQVEYTDGKESLVRTYEYSGNLLLRVSVQDGKGVVLYRDSYSEGPDGRLRRAVRSAPGGANSVTSLTYDGSHVVTEWLGSGTAGTLYRYSGGELVSKESWDGVQLQSEERVSANTAGKTTVTKDVSTGTTTKKVYNPKGLIESEETTEKGSVIRSVAYSYHDGKLEMKVTKTPGQREEVQYEYDAHGELLSSRTTVNRQLVKVTRYTGKETSVEDLYLNGAVVLHVFYEKGKKVREVAASSPDSVGTVQGAGG